MTVIL